MAPNMISTFWSVSSGMWMALTDTIVADGDGTQWEATAWDGLWAKKPSPVHNKVTEPLLSKRAMRLEFCGT